MFEYLWDTAQIPIMPQSPGHTAQVLCSFSELLSRTDRRTGARCTG